MENEVGAMDRRSFLRRLAGGVIVASTNPVHFLAPPTSWHLQNGLYASNGSLSSNWSSKTPEDIMADMMILVPDLLRLPVKYFSRLNDETDLQLRKRFYDAK
jgi:hypothetical protein